MESQVLVPLLAAALSSKLRCVAVLPGLAALLLMFHGAANVLPRNR